jgi:uridine kinase
MNIKELVITAECKKRFLPIVKLIEDLLDSECTSILIGIDGMCASGKTTLGYYLKNKFDCNLFHMDDFFLQEHQRTPERLREIGSNVDYERFKIEVLTPILNKQDVLYRPYSCDIGKIQSETEISYNRLNIVEGSYCQHPYFGDIYQAKIFMSLSDNEQIERIRIRNGNDMLSKFISEWIPKENEYFTQYHIREDSVMIENRTCINS